MGCILQNIIVLNLSFGVEGPWYYGFVGESVMMSAIYFQKKCVYVCACSEKETVWGGEMVNPGGVSSCSLFNSFSFSK